jgi:hypothetical protein
MSNNSRLSGPSLVVRATLFICLVVGGCQPLDGANSDPAKPACGNSPDPCSVSVQPPAATLRVGDTFIFVAVPTAAVPNPRFSWTTGDAAKVSVDSLGKAKALATSAQTAVCVKVIDTNLQACSIVTVTP